MNSIALNVERLYKGQHVKAYSKVDIDEKDIPDLMKSHLIEVIVITGKNPKKKVTKKKKIVKRTVEKSEDLDRRFGKRY